MTSPPITCSCSTFDPLALRVIQRTQRGGGRVADPGYFDLVIIRPDAADRGAVRCGHVPQSHGGAQRMSVHSRPDEADDVIPVPDRLIVVEQGFGRFELELHQSLEAPRLLLAHECFAADESARLVPADRET